MYDCETENELNKFWKYNEMVCVIHAFVAYRGTLIKV